MPCLMISIVVIMRSPDAVGFPAFLVYTFNASSNAGRGNESYILLDSPFLIALG